MKMKKNYLKPDIFFEDFAFSSNIAASCGVTSSLHSQDGCTYYASFGDPRSCIFVNNDWVVFSNYSSCEWAPEEKDPTNLCYHVSSDDTRMFAS
jgi:hypothetical protein